MSSVTIASWRTTLSLPARLDPVSHVKSSILRRAAQNGAEPISSFPTLPSSITVPISTTREIKSISGQIRTSSGAKPEDAHERQKNLAVNRCVELSSQLCPFCGGGEWRGGRMDGSRD